MFVYGQLITHALTTSSQPIQADEVQTFKALITIHRVIQEGHPAVLRDAQQNASWIESISRVGMGDGLKGYGQLIREHVNYIVSKLRFHRDHPDFNGTFEYEEYISLKMVSDPNEGYETIGELMNLQDQMEGFYRLVFHSISGGIRNECRMSALLPIITESFGIYEFITSMLKAMYSCKPRKTASSCLDVRLTSAALGDDSSFLGPLHERFNSQHYRLYRFYSDCANIPYLTKLVVVPKLSPDPPDLLPADDEPRAPMPSRPKQEPEREPEPVRVSAPDPEPINEFWQNEQARQQQEYQAEQQRLQQQYEDAQRQRDQEASQRQRDFDEQQRMLAEQQRLAQEQLARDQFQQHSQGRMAELERENQNARMQYERDQMMLQQYDQRMQALEAELQQIQSNSQQQHQSKDEQIRALQEQVNTWRSKYEALAKLYSQLRSEHLDLLQKFKSVQLKAASAQEAIDKREKLERELKTKNLELADMIRDRDKAYHERDRTSGGHKDELEKLRRELRFALEKADNAERAKGSDLSAMLARHNREITDLEEALRNKSRALDDAQLKTHEGDSDLQRLLHEKEEELEIYKHSLDEALVQVAERQTDGDVSGAHVDLSKIGDLIDSVLQSGVQRVDDSLYELDSTLIAGNQNATGPYVLSQIEKAMSSATEFSTAFNEFIADGPAADHKQIIRLVHSFSGAIADVLSNTKGLSRFATDDKKGDQLINGARQSAQSTVDFFRAIQSYRLADLEDLQKTDVVINKNNDVQINLNQLSKLADALAPKSKISTSGDLGELVDREMTNAAKAIEAATDRLTKLMNKPRDAYSTYELKIHDSILEAAIAVTNAIARLIKAATDSQREIVAQGRGTSMSATQFYKRNNRWTEGLISASKAVASSTNMLIETADGVISGTKTPEQLIVASNDVAASTAQLVAASRVKASFMSKTQERLEDASKAVTGACRGLVKKVQEIIEMKNRNGDDESMDYTKLSGHEFKVRQMEQQVRWHLRSLIVSCSLLTGAIHLF